MPDTRIARRYASAVFKIGEQQGANSTLKRGQYLQSLDQMLTDNADLHALLKSPIFSAAEKKQVLATLCDKLNCDELTRNFCFVLADKERLSCLHDIVKEYTSILDKSRGIIRGTLTTAIPLTKDKQKSVKTELEKKANATLELSFDVDSAILGGIVLKVGDRVLDASLRAQLEILRDTFKRGN